MITARRMRAGAGAGALLPTDVGTPTRPSTPLQRFPASRENPVAFLWIPPDDTTDGRACRDDPSVSTAICCSPAVSGYFTPGSHDEFGDFALSPIASWPPTTDELEGSARRAARDAARMQYEHGHFRGYGEYGAGDYSGAITIAHFGIRRADDYYNLTNIFADPADAVSSTNPTAMIDKPDVPSPWNPTTGATGIPTGEFTAYMANGLARVRDVWTPAFLSELRRQQDAFVPDGGGEPVALCRFAEIHFDWEDLSDLRNYHNTVFTTEWARNTDIRNHFTADRPDGTPTDRFTTEVLYLGPSGEPSTFSDWWGSAIANGYTDGVLPLPIDQSQIYLGSLIELGHELAHFLRASAEYGLSEAFARPYKVAFPGLVAVSNYSWMHRIDSSKSPSQLGLNYMRHPIFTCQSLEFYGEFDAGVVGSPTVTVEDRWASFAQRIGGVDFNRPAVAWVFVGNDGTPGTALAYGDHAQQLEILKRAWLAGFYRFYAWGDDSPGLGLGNTAAWHKNVWVPFRAWVADQVGDGGQWKRLSPRGYRGRPSRATRVSRVGRGRA